MCFRSVTSLGRSVKANTRDQTVGNGRLSTPPLDWRAGSEGTEMNIRSEARRADPLRGGACAVSTLHQAHLLVLGHPDQAR